jgi:ferredoxin--NADP+ reductase
VRIEGEGKVERLIVETTRLDEANQAVGTGEHLPIECGLVVSCIGYKTPPIEGVPYEADRAASPIATAGSPGALLRRMGTARAQRDDRHQPARTAMLRRLIAGIWCGRQAGGRADRLLAARVEIVPSAMAEDRGGRGARARDGSRRRSSTPYPTCWPARIKPPNRAPAWLACQAASL